MINMADRSITWRLRHRAIRYRLSCHTVLEQNVWATGDSVLATLVVREVAILVLLTKYEVRNWGSSTWSDVDTNRYRAFTREFWIFHRGVMWRWVSSVRRFQETCRSIYQDGSNVYRGPHTSRHRNHPPSDGPNMIRYDIYLLRLCFHPVAVDLTLRTEGQNSNIHREKQYRSQNTLNRKQDI
jgi:hypothetical protein